ncbi:Gaa1-domain-containing protein [Macrolepiota fuliginosa MF-IS2]|uniref:Gaa1-domain-containing protein n=1 Tax=Macrolepiota fuliginosa MF-IS2 TaxID=1400762 RepID=A0A9P6CA55_9AGAR|nr:Gaa1-domain-containing protein [Macrolepiota fuliginosa MF-IS2]
MDNNPPPNPSPWLRLFRRNPNATTTRLRRRQATVSFFTRRLSQIIVALLAVGYFWLLILPSPRLGRGTYIDENALQPGQVNTYWNWGDVHAADVYLEQLELLRDSNATSHQRAQFLMNEFAKLGLSPATQKYSFQSSSNHGSINGANAYAILASPRGPRNEAMVISASWLSRIGEGDGTLNLRGVSTVLALARFLKNYSLWAKDIVFVIGDGYLDGMHAWLNAYHGVKQSNLEAEPLELTSGVIWTALNIDYPGHSFSHLGLFFEGLNGRLPNQDLMNSVQHIARYTGQVPVTVYDHLEWRDPSAQPSELTFLPSPLCHHPEIKEFAYRAKNILRHIGYQARGRASGVHGLYHQFRIDAVTVFAVPAIGPHGFHALGRIVESSLRTMNNLLERLHASFFFFILTTPDQFMKIGSYLPSAILISVAMMFRGLRCWVDAGWRPDHPHSKKGDHSPRIPVWSRRSRPVLHVFAMMLMTHLCGVVLFLIVRSSFFLYRQKLLTPLIVLAVSLVPFVVPKIYYPFHQGVAPAWLLLKALNLCFASTVISTITVLNFSLAALLAVALGLPLLLAQPSKSTPLSWFKYILYTLLASGWLFLFQEVRDAIWQWEILSVWFAPFFCLVYTPLVIQAGIVCILPHS